MASLETSYSCSSCSSNSCGVPFPSSSIITTTTTTTTTATATATTALAAAFASTTLSISVGQPPPPPPLQSPPPDDPASILWLTLSLMYSAVYLLQRIAFSTTKFATYTLPTWLFTLFSMSLTFTMNFTTLYPTPLLEEKGEKKEEKKRPQLTYVLRD